MDATKPLMDVGERISLGGGYLFELQKIELIPATGRPLYNGFLLKDGKYVRDTLISDIIIREAKGVK